MKKSIVTLFHLLIYFQIFGQYTAPNPTSVNSYTKMISVNGNPMTPIAITTHVNKSTQVEKVAVTYYNPSFAHNTKVEIYNTLADFESGTAPSKQIAAVGVADSLKGVEALTYDKTMAGNLFVMETKLATGSRLSIFDSNGVIVTSFTSSEIQVAIGGGFNNARGIACDDSNNVYIADNGNNRILKIANPLIKSSAKISEYLILPIGSNPQAVCIQGNFIYITCLTSKTIRKYNLSTKAYIDEVSTAPDFPIDIAVKSDGSHIYCSTEGNSPGLVKAYNLSLGQVQTYNDFSTLYGPWGLAVSSKGDLYCSDGGNNRFIRYKRTRLADKEILSYTIPTQIGTSIINTTARTISLTMPASADLSSLIPTFVLSPLSTSSKNTGIADNFSSPVSMIINADDGSSKTYTINVTKTTSGIENTAKTNLAVYLNPISNQFTISSSTLLEKIEIYTLAGKSVFKIQPKSNSLQVQSEDWPQGIFILTYTDHYGNISTQKIIK